MKEDLPLSAVHDTDKFLGVSTVVIEQDSVDITSKKVIEDVLQTSEAIRFDESSVSFNPETAELADPATAKYCPGRMVLRSNFIISKIIR